MKFIKLATIIALVLLIFQNCSQPEGPTYCTAEFVMHSVTVLDQDGTPADSVQITVINEGDDSVYPCDEYLCKESQPGTYTIMHDGFLEDLSSNGETVVVEGVKDSLQFSEEFIFQGDECHVVKLAGPDTVSFSSN